MDPEPKRQRRCCPGYDDNRHSSAVPDLLSLDRRIGWTGDGPGVGRGWAEQNFTVPTSGTYFLSYDSFGGRGTFETNYSYEVAIIDTFGGGATAWSKSEAIENTVTYHLESFSATAGTTYKLRFQSTGGVAGTSLDAGNLFFDRVNITEVPEPNACLLSLGAGGILLGRRRRR